MGMAHDQQRVLNGICPYYTMFPLSFPLRVLQRGAKKGDYVVDPFCGRGTTNFAARLLGLPSFGVDSSPIAVALTQAKLADARVSDVVRVARNILGCMPNRVSVPRGEFWELAYHSSVLKQLCWLRKELRRDCRSDSRILLRAIVLGALHGPQAKTRASYFSNQCPRTYAPKPDYAVRFWRKRRLKPQAIDVIGLVTTRAQRFLSDRPRRIEGGVALGDSRDAEMFGTREFRWAITSPPYYGMRTYIPDQWLRNWFLGARAKVTYRPPVQEMSHGSPDIFAEGLRKVWSGLAEKGADDARLVVRFGGIADRDVDPVQLLKFSMERSGWRLNTVVSAGDADHGRRQSTQFSNGGAAPVEEHDFYASLC